MSDHALLVSALVVAVVGGLIVPFVVSGLRRSEKAHLIPSFDHPWSKPPGVENRNAVVVRNIGKADALRVTIDPIELEDAKLLTAGEEANIPPGHEHSFVLKLARFQDSSPLSRMHQTVDVPDVVWRASVIRALRTRQVQSETWPVFASFRDLKKRRYRCVWQFEDDIATHRARIVFVDQFKANVADAS